MQNSSTCFSMQSTFSLAPCHSECGQGFIELLLLHNSALIGGAFSLATATMSWLIYKSRLSRKRSFIGVCSALRQDTVFFFLSLTHSRWMKFNSHAKLLRRYSLSKWDVSAGVERSGLATPWFLSLFAARQQSKLEKLEKWNKKGNDWNPSWHVSLLVYI